MVNVMDLIYEKEAVNAAKLHEELAAALGAKFVGISLGGEPGQVRVHVQEDLSSTKRNQIASLIAAHDPAKLTTAQQAEADRAAKLEALKKPWAQWIAADREEYLRILAEQAGIIPIG